jgi:hypothetical protein
MTDIGRFPGIHGPGTHGPSEVPPAAPRQPENAPSSTGLQSTRTTVSHAPRGASLPPSSGTQTSTSPAGAQVAWQPANAYFVHAKAARQSLGIQPDKLLSSEVMGKAHSLENIAQLKVEILGMKEDVDAARGSRKSDPAAAAAARQLHAELDSALGFLKGQEQKLAGAQRAGSPARSSPASKPATTPLTSARPAADPAEVQKNLKQMFPDPWIKMPWDKSPSPSEKVADAYKQINLQLTADTFPAFSDQHIAGEPKELGSGALNTVYALELSQPDGSVFKGVYKKLGGPEGGVAAQASGIPRNDPQVAMRNLATVAYDKALGFNVIPQTKVAVFATDEKPEVGLVMAMAQGKSAKQTDTETLLRPDVIRETTKLQLLDALAGQVDRHGENYFVHVGTDGKATVTGIDNDACFGKNLTHPNQARLDLTNLNTGNKGASLPPVVDTDMAAAIQAMTPDGIRQSLGDKLTKEEVEAAVARLGVVQHHVAGLAANGRVIDPGNWESAKPLLTFDNSIAMRNVLIRDSAGFKKIIADAFESAEKQ